MVDDKSLKFSASMAMDWLVDVAQVKTKELTIELNNKNFCLESWEGAIKGEYSVATKQWDFFCPCWHTGQAIKSLIMGCQRDLVGNKDKYVTAAKLGAKFIMDNQKWDPNDDDHGLILAFEDHPNLVNISAILESCDGLFYISEYTGDPVYEERAIAALDLVERRFYYHGTGLFPDAYDPANKSIRSFSADPQNQGRPLIDDYIFLKAYRKTKNKKYLKVFLETCQCLMDNEYPPGNWIKYAPANANEGFIHPRHTYWWGTIPFTEAYLETGNKEFLDVARRSAEWYARAVRKDGGLFRDTYLDFSTPSFGHATSGVACAIMNWIRFKQVTNTNDFDKLIDKCLEFCRSIQFTLPEDENLYGCILEKVLHPRGSDHSPFHVRDLGTIFYIQAVARYFD
ncbi:MAG: hypothetical protein ACTSWN_02305 [Promethearchaeota archaeon]